MKILWVSEFDIPSGFARVSKALIKNLQKQFDITVLDWYAEKDGFSSGVKVLGKKSADDQLALARFMDVYREYDAIFFLNDVWNIAKYLKALASVPRWDLQSGIMPKIVTYFPVDAEMHNPDWYDDFFTMVSNPVTYTDFASNVVLKACPTLEGRLQIIPHGIDTDTFYPIKTPKTEIREYLYNTKQLSDAFIFMNANRNQMRKRIDITILAFAEFLNLTKAPKALLHLHCGLQDYGFDIMDLVERLGISNRIIVTGNAKGMQNISNEMLNLYYNSADVGLNSSLGEGWGLVGCEHGATGAPQIVPQHSACAEIFAGKALMIPSALETVFPQTNTIGRVPDHHEMAKLMADYYTEPTLREKHGNSLAQHFEQSEFNWKNISEKFAKLFIS